MIKPISHSQRLMDVQNKTLAEENRKLLSRLVNAPSSITPWNKVQSDYKKHKKMVRSI